MTNNRNGSGSAVFSVAAIIGMALALSACSDISFFFHSGKPYHNDSYGFKVKYPPGWEVNDTGYLNTAVLFISNQQDDNFKANVNVYVRDAEGLILQQYVSKSKKGLESELAAQIGYRLKKFISEGKTRLGNHDAYQLTYLFNQNGADLESRSVYLIRNEKAYLVTCTAKEAEFEKHAKEFDLVIGSFRIK